MSGRFRQVLYCLVMVVFVTALVFGVVDLPVFSDSQPSLSEPIVTGNSLEICLNSRDTGSTPSGNLSDQQLSNIFWAAARAPVTGTDRDIYVTTVNGTYGYDPYNNEFDYYSGATRSSNVFLSYDNTATFDEGTSYMSALLASVSLWESSESPVAGAPRLSKVLFGIDESLSLDNTLAVTSSDSSLPDPDTDGDNTIEAVLAKLNYTDDFIQTDLTLQQISQLLWAGYGCTPHTTYNGNKGLTVPSAFADYYLTECIYVLNEDGVYRYHNRTASYDFSTQDHRIEQTVDGDVRGNLRNNVSGLSEAPCYIVLCLDYDYISYVDNEHGDYAATERSSVLETGFVASNMLMQATALGFGADFELELTSGEQTGIKNTANITSTQTPMVIVSIGPPARPRSLVSYSDAGHTTECNSFADYNTEHTAYMYGTNLTPGRSYKVVYYDGGGDNVYEDTGLTAGALGNISSQRTFVDGTDVAGKWNVIVCEDYLTPPSSYNDSWAYTVVSDGFIVQESAIPESPAVAAAVGALGLCVGVYFWMRRRAAAVGVSA